MDEELPPHIRTHAPPQWSDVAFVSKNKAKQNITAFASRFVYLH